MGVLVRVMRRQTGKTRHLIEQSAEKQIPIIVGSRQRAGHIRAMAQQMHVRQIPEPVVISNLIYELSIAHRNFPTGEALIDDLDDVLFQILYLLGIHSVETTVSLDKTTVVIDKRPTLSLDRMQVTLTSCSTDVQTSDKQHCDLL